MSVEQLFDTLTIRIDGPKAWSEHLTIAWRCTDLNVCYPMTLSYGVLTYYPAPTPGDTGRTFTLTKPQLLGMLASGTVEG